MQIPVLSNIPHCKWWPGLQYYNDRSALDNSSEGPKICNYTAVAPDLSITALRDSPWKGNAFINTTLSDRKLGTLMFCCCLFWLTKTGYTTGKQLWRRKIWQITKSQRSEEPSVLTSGLNDEPGEWIEMFQNTINPSWNKEKSFPEEISRPGLLMSHYSVNTKSWLPQPCEKLARFYFIFIAICHESNSDFQMPKFLALKRLWKKRTWLKQDPPDDSLCNKQRYQSPCLPEELFLPSPLLLELRVGDSDLFVSQ